MERLLERDRIRLLQYENLRKHFMQLVHDVLGEHYYNEGMDVYTCDKLCCRDLKRKLCEPSGSKGFLAKLFAWR